MRKIYLLLATIIFLSSPAWSQVKISGTVKDTKGSVLPGVTVVEKGTSKGTSTNNEGNFSIEVSSNDALLIFSYLGYHKQELKASAAESVTLIEEVVALVFQL